MAIEDFYIEATRKTLNTSSKNDNYEYEKTYTESTINCYIGSRSSYEKREGGKWVTRDQYKFYADTLCIYGDLIVYKNETYRLIADSQNTINLDHHYKSYVEKLENIT